MKQNELSKPALLITEAVRQNLNADKLINKYIFLIFTIFTIELNIEKEYFVQLNPIELVQNGITVTELRNSTKNGEFIKEPLYKYGIDSEDFGLTYIKNGEKIFFIWTKYDSDLIHEIILLDNSLTIDNISVGKSFNDFLKTNPNSTIELDVVNSEYEYAESDNGEYFVEFLTQDNKVAEYNNDNSCKRIINGNAKIDRIRIHKSE